MQHATSTLLQHILDALSPILEAAESLAVAAASSSPGSATPFLSPLSAPSDFSAPSPHSTPMTATIGAVRVVHASSEFMHLGGQDQPQVTNLQEVEASGVSTPAPRTHPSWVGFWRRLRGTIRARLPDPSTLVALLASLEKDKEQELAPAAAAAAAHEQGVDGVERAAIDGVGERSSGGRGREHGRGSGGARAQRLLLRHAALRALGWYCRWLGEAVGDAHLDSIGKLLGPEVGDSALGVRVLFGNG